MGQMFLYHLSSDGPGYFILGNSAGHPHDRSFGAIVMKRCHL
jgi:hypothetical protein